MSHFEPVETVSGKPLDGVMIHPTARRMRKYGNSAGCVHVTDDVHRGQCRLGDERRAADADVATKRIVEGLGGVDVDERLGNVRAADAAAGRHGFDPGELYVDAEAGKALDDGLGTRRTKGARVTGGGDQPLVVVVDEQAENVDLTVVHIGRELDARDDLEVVRRGGAACRRDARDDVVVGNRQSGKWQGDGPSDELLRRETAVREGRVRMQFGKSCGGDFAAPVSAWVEAIVGADGTAALQMRSPLTTGSYPAAYNSVEEVDLWISREPTNNAS